MKFGLGCSSRLTPSWHSIACSLGLDAGRLEEKTQGVAMAEIIPECKRVVRKKQAVEVSHVLQNPRF